MSEPQARVTPVPAAQGQAMGLLALVSCQVGLHACTQGARLAAPLQALQQGQGAFAVGVLLAFFALVPAVFAIPAGRMADRFGFHRPVRVAATLSLLGALCGALSGHVLALCATAALCGAGSGFGMIAVQRTASRMARSTAERISIFSRVALAPSVANLVGPLLAGVLIDHYGFRAAFLALALLPAATLLIAGGVPRELIARAAPAATAPPPAWQMLGSPAFRRLLFINWLVSTSWDVFGFALPILGHARGFSAASIGSVLAAYAVASMAVRLLIPLVAERLSRRLMMVGALGLAGAVLLVFPSLGAVWAMGLGASVLGLALGAIQPAILASVHEVAPPGRQGEALALRAMSVHLSMTTMPLVFGAAGAALGASTLLGLMACALALGTWQARNGSESHADH
ncbi:MFS transporter [Pelomonas aquatica]|jgi:MFS family permease|uniref:MFS transporter n=2 Tax=Pseudomonadota TaxID=1224 RepID=A0A9X4R652_9BURK|nr:MFS transporter [Pelomonas aquatica]MCY4756599.1 MFS transporter [Pelomonas aquatica]MDG0863954.1 MFS transporter [Pelomonas aquatica]